MTRRCRTLGVVVVLTLGGCAVEPGEVGFGTSPNLLMSTPLLLETQRAHEVPDRGWETVRNGDFRYRDPDWIPDYRDRLYLQTRYRERLRTSNGRPREQSTYQTLGIAERLQ